MKQTRGIVYIVDDDESIRKALARLLLSYGLACEHFACGEDFLIFRHALRPSCLILDVQLPTINGLQLQEAIALQNILIPIIFISGHGTIPVSVRAMKAGAVDFLSKPFSDQELVGAVRHALEADSVQWQHEKNIQRINALLQTLTPREYEVMRWVITGKLNKQIARCLETTEKTVKVHRGRLMKKLGVLSVAQLVRLTQKANIQPAEKD